MHTLNRVARMSPVGHRARFRDDLGRRGVLDAGLLKRDSDTLVVTFHGALDREKFSIPRFERARTTEPFGTSCLYWSDPSLWLDERLGLSWFVGSGRFDLLSELAARSIDVAHAIGATNVIFTGSSGGGFAALQVSALASGTTALAFNPQTEVYRYWKSAQRDLIRVCFPNLLSQSVDEFDFAEDWTEALGDRLSALRRYSSGTRNRAIYWTNVHDWHDQKHRRPFERAAVAAGADLVVRRYYGPEGHHPPATDVFVGAMKEALELTTDGAWQPAPASEAG